MPKAEPDIAEVNVEHTLVVLRSENARLRECVKANEETQVRNQEIQRKNYEGWRQENLRLQSELLASQERVFELQDNLLSLRRIVNSVPAKE